MKIECSADSETIESLEGHPFIYRALPQVQVTRTGLLLSRPFMAEGRLRCPDCQFKYVTVSGLFVPRIPTAFGA